METKLCRICGKLGQNYVHIFRTEGLKNKIETCLPIFVSPHSLLPDTICGECSENVYNFYSFIKNCLQNIIILEAQYDISESCLKTKRKKEKGCMTEITVIRDEKIVQTDDFLDVLIGDSDLSPSNFPLTSKVLKTNSIFNNEENQKSHSLVDYDVESDTNSEIGENNGIVLLTPRFETMKKINSFVDNLLSSKNNFALSKQYFDDAENDLIMEIAQRKSLKRKSDAIETRCPKIFKMDTINRRKSKQPKKLDKLAQESLHFETIEMRCEGENNESSNVLGGTSEVIKKEPYISQDQKIKEENSPFPQLCLLCDLQFSGPAALASHVFETHGIDMAEIVASGEYSTNERKKKIPNLVKISDLKKSETTESNHQFEHQSEECTSANATSSFSCPNCASVFGLKADLFTHLKLKHSDSSSLLCGLCLYPATSYTNLKTHLEMCSQKHEILTRYVCQICMYGEDNFKVLENHIILHSFLLEACKKQAKMFDPADYIDTNENFEGTGSPNMKNLTCSECGMANFDSFKEFSTHRRSQHTIFHCDLCNKFYGRNSHLWKHVNRLHKGHPSITCQLCYKTSASKYHLSQHFNKIHSAKPCKQKLADTIFGENESPEDFMSQKFQAFDFQSVKQSFMKQEILEQERIKTEESEEVLMTQNSSEPEDNEEILGKPEPVAEPKEIDSSSNLYTNIITNYTPPANEGEFKCPKCGKGFHKKTLLKKHKKNCRPRLQKDLLTRCKSCARIFKDRQSLTKHLVNYHSEYVCEICGQKVQSKCEIVSHIRFSHPGCHLVCKICGNILRSRDDLNEHTRDHANSYVCQFCADALPSKIKLKMHILSLHRKILSLSCGVCLKLFETQHILRDHVRLVHKDQLAPLTSCPVCGKNYGSKWKTYDHLNKSHGRIFRACKTCLEIFDDEVQLQVHYETAHLMQSSNTAIKNSIVNNTTLNISNLVINNDANNYESESAQEDDESNDEEDDKQSDSDSQKPEIPVLSNLSHDTKISLLEKRLLGKKITEEDTQMLKNKTVNNCTGKMKILSNDIKPNKTELKKEKVESLVTAQTKKELEESSENLVVNSPNPHHNSSKRTVYVNSNDPSFCEICHKTWPAKKHLWQHYIRCHKSVAATVCGICLKTNKDYPSLQQHLTQTHPTLLHGQGYGSNFICRICGRYHNASSKLKLHMAIHENFDWSLLSENPGNSIQQQGNAVKQETNGFQEFKSEIKYEELYDANEDINYESLIEQVECSSQSENEESEADGQMKQEQDSSSEEDEDEETDNDSCSENSLESEMLKNMLREKQRMLNEATLIVQNQENNDENSTTEESSSSTISDNQVVIKSEQSSAEEDEEVSQDSQSISSKYVIIPQANSTIGDSVIHTNIFNRKPEELDSAIKSISYECIEQIDEDLDDDYCDLQTHNLNENEIESAVGSIL